MSRVTRGYKARRRRKKILRAAKGYRGLRSKVYRRAKEAVLKAWSYSYRDRRNKKREFRRLWITRIGAACKSNGTSYSKFIKGLKDAEIEIDRKILADIAVRNPVDFEFLVRRVQQGL